MQAFKEAVEARDLARMTSLLAEDVTFWSPASHKPYQGREQVGWILATVATVLEDFVYLDAIETGRTSALHFRARVGDREAQGIDLIELNQAGLIQTFTVFVRPLSALQALADQMRIRFSRR